MKVEESEGNALTKTRNQIILSVDGQGFIRCPYCRFIKPIKRVSPDEHGENILAYCSHCKREIVLNIEKGRNVTLQS